jgi:tRNA threonylcarbamoyladenosine biosynthesis protein TsaE
MTEVRFVADDEHETDRLGVALASAVEPGLVVALVGNLGAGKTRLVRGVAAALDVDPLCVSSPTFVLIHEYDGRIPVYHFDTYRLRNSAEFLELGADELLDGDGVCFVEWADKVASTLPVDCLRVEIAACGETAREFRLTAGGERSARCLARVAATLKVLPSPTGPPAAP